MVRGLLVVLILREPDCCLVLQLFLLLKAVGMKLIGRCLLEVDGEFRLATHMAFSRVPTGCA